MNLIKIQKKLSIEQYNYNNVLFTKVLEIDFTIRKNRQDSYKIFGVNQQQ